MKSKKQKGLKSYSSGHFAEKVAMLYLMVKGYYPVARNHKISNGTGANEIDLVMKRGRTLVFVEVKKRKTLDDCRDAITSTLQNRIVRAAEVFLNHHPKYEKYNCRFDVVFVYGFHVKHFKDIFEGEGNG